MTKLSSSPDRNTFQKEGYLLRQAEKGKSPENDEETRAMVEYYDSWNIKADKQEADPEWQKDNMEFDLRSSEWMVAKVRAREEYAQNLYAAMCNRDFVKNDVWPLLKNQTWSCSWRYAGGIVAHMMGRGDYIDWYCSGIKTGPLDENERAKLTEDTLAEIDWMNKHFVGEGHVTDEIRADLLKLGWVVVDDEPDCF